MISPIPSYEQRLILFLDFLGFKEIVDETAADENKLRSLFKAYDLVSEFRDKEEVYRSKRVSQFSDSVVVSYHVQENSAVFDLIADVSLTVVDLANWGYLVRGAVTVGQLIHTEKYLLGPAMVRAYLMESKRAKFPRVIIDPQVFKVARKYRSNIHSADEEEEYVRSYTSKDDDGRYFLDYISFSGVVSACGIETHDYGNYLRRIGSMVERLLRHEDVGVREKGLWLRERYVRAIKNMRSAHPKFRTEYPDLLTDIADLKTFKRLARLARS